MKCFEDLWDSHPSVRKEGFPCHASFHDAFLINKSAIELGTAMARCGISTGDFPHVRHCMHHGVSQGHVLSAEGLAKGLSDYPVKGIQGKITLEPCRFPTALQGQKGIVFVKARILVNGLVVRNRNRDIIDLWNINRFAFTKNPDAISDMLEPLSPQESFPNDNLHCLWFWKCYPW